MTNDLVIDSRTSLTTLKVLYGITYCYACEHDSKDHWAIVSDVQEEIKRRRGGEAWLESQSAC